METIRQGYELIPLHECAATKEERGYGNWTIDQPLHHRGSPRRLAGTSERVRELHLHFYVACRASDTLMPARLMLKSRASYSKVRMDIPRGLEKKFVFERVLFCKVSLAMEATAQGSTVRVA